MGIEQGGSMNQEMEVSEEQLMQEAGQFINTEGKSLSHIARELDSVYSGNLAAKEILSAQSLEEIQTKAQKQEAGRALYVKIVDKIHGPVEERPLM